jgi:signal transduction histidine kinase
MEEHLRQSEKMEAIGQLAGGIAHDFNNQLTAIMGCAELLRDDFSDDPEHLEDIYAIIKTVERATSLTAQLLAFSRKGISQTVVFDLHQTIQEVSSILERTLEKNITIRKVLSAVNPMITGDPAQIQNVILNLALNARDAMPIGGEITISTSVRTGAWIDTFYPLNLNEKQVTYIVLSVKDTGTGMDEETKKRIFEPFFTTKEKGKGTGMGLANVYNTIKNHNGLIDVISKPDSGTEIKIFLPQYQSNQDKNK